MFPQLIDPLKINRAGPGRPRTRPDRVRGDRPVHAQRSGACPEDAESPPEPSHISHNGNSNITVHVGNAGVMVIALSVTITWPADPWGESPEQQPR